MHIAIAREVIEDLLPSLEDLHSSLKSKARVFQKHIKIGRTHLQDAVPMTLGQEFGAFAHQISKGISSIKNSLGGILELAQGGTAVGTGLNCPDGFVKFFIENLNGLTSISFKTAPNKFEALASHDAICQISSSLCNMAMSLFKIANDIRLLGSGPRCGLHEIILPENEPGSSIMPGKVNPTQCEAMTMICAQVYGNHATVAFANSQGHFQLNVFKPVIAFNALQSIRLLADGCHSFRVHCIDGMNVDREKLKLNVENSLMLVTALNPYIGYDKASKIAKKAYQEGLSLKDAAVSLGFLSADEFERYVKPKDMV